MQIISDVDERATDARTVDELLAESKRLRLESKFLMAKAVALARKVEALQKLTDSAVREKPKLH